MIITIIIKILIIVTVAVVIIIFFYCKHCFFILYFRCAECCMLASMLWLCVPIAANVHWLSQTVFFFYLHDKILFIGSKDAKNSEFNFEIPKKRLEMPMSSWIRRCCKKNRY